MKRFICSLSMALIAVAMMAQQPTIRFERTEHDFGKINEADGRVTTEFKFTNEGMTPLVLSNVRASCGCTTPKWTKEPIQPGESGEITVTYNPNGRPGRFQKTITVTSNCAEPTSKLYIKGEVIPKPAKPVDNYPVKMSELSLKSSSANFGTIKKGDVGTKEIEFANQTDKVITLAVQSAAKEYLTVQTTLAEIQPKQTGKINISFASATCKNYGPVKAKVYVLVNGVKSEDNVITVSTDIIDNVTLLSTEQRQQAPILEMASVVDLGTIVAGKKSSYTFSVRNAGPQTPLMIRTLACDASNIIFSAPKAIKKGQKGTIKVQINAVKNGKAMEPGKYAQKVNVYSNDPTKPKTTITLNYEVK